MCRHKYRIKFFSPPPIVQIQNLTTNSYLASHGMLAHTFYSRLKGLIGTKTLQPGSGMVIRPCRTIHTCFMRFNLDLIFVSRNDQVCAIIENLPPYRITPIIKPSYYVIELPAGTIQNSQTQIGDLISLS